MKQLETNEKHNLVLKFWGTTFQISHFLYITTTGQCQQQTLWKNDYEFRNNEEMEGIRNIYIILAVKKWKEITLETWIQLVG
jgi:hypothetical protein